MSGLSLADPGESLERRQSRSEPAPRVSANSSLNEVKALLERYQQSVLMFQSRDPERDRLVAVEALGSHSNDPLAAEHMLSVMNTAQSGHLRTLLLDGLRSSNLPDVTGAIELEELVEEISAKSKQPSEDIGRLKELAQGLGRKLKSVASVNRIESEMHANPASAELLAGALRASTFPDTQRLLRSRLTGTGLTTESRQMHRFAALGLDPALPESRACLLTALECSEKGNARFIVTIIQALGSLKPEGVAEKVLPKVFSSDDEIQNAAAMYFRQIPRAAVPAELKSFATGSLPAAAMRVASARGAQGLGLVKTALGMLFSKGGREELRELQESLKA